MAVQHLTDSRSARVVTGASNLERLIVRLVTLVETWVDCHRQRRQLVRLPDHLLRDMGISRADALREADKPFWRV